MSVARAARRLPLSLSLSLSLAASLLLAAAPVHAVVVVGVWDPAYGAGLPGYGWRGRVELSIPDDCSSAPAGPRYAVSPGCSTPWTVLGATVEFYADPGPLPAPTVETLDFAPLLTIDRLEVGPGSSDFEIVGFSTADPVATPGGRAARSLYSSYFQKYFALDFDFQLGAGQPRTLALLYLTDDPQEAFSGPFGFQYANENEAVVRVGESAIFPSPVPTPSTAWLAAAALVALGATLARRRPAARRRGRG